MGCLRTAPGWWVKKGARSNLNCLIVSHNFSPHLLIFLPSSQPLCLVMNTVNKSRLGVSVGYARRCRGWPRCCCFQHSVFMGQPQRAATVVPGCPLCPWPAGTPHTTPETPDIVSGMSAPRSARHSSVLVRSMGSPRRKRHFVFITARSRANKGMF